MPGYAFEHYVDLATRMAPYLPEDEAGRLAFTERLDIGSPEGFDDAQLAQAVFNEAQIVAGALNGHVPTNRKILLHDSNSLRIKNDPTPGWLVAHIQGQPHRHLEDLGQEHRDSPRPVLLTPDARLYVYDPGPTPADRPADGVMRNWYVPAVPEAGFPENSRAMLLGYAMLVAAPPVPQAEAPAA